MTLNDVITLILRYFTEFGNFRGFGSHCVKVIDKAVTMDTPTMPMYKFVADS